jgi:uncharacterized membrane protein YbhN (UPF0104 family)
MPPHLLLITQSIAQRLPAPGSPQRRRLMAAGAVAVAAAVAFLLAPALARVPQRLGRGCGRWLAAASAFELLSALGFVVVFKLVFGAFMRWRSSSRVGLSVLAASTLLPAGGVLGPALGAWITRTPERPTVARSRAIAFVLLTNAPSVLVVGLVGMALGFRWIRGPHAAALTFVPAAGAFIVLGAVASLPLLARRPSPRTRERRWAAVYDGAREADAVIWACDWKLLGAAAYFAFDNAALWAAFRAFGHSPSFGVVAMAYVLGGVGAALPLPAGLGGVEAGLVGSLVLYGTPAAPAAAAVLVYRAVSLAVPVLLGAGALLEPRHGLASKTGRKRSLSREPTPPRHPPQTAEPPLDRLRGRDDGLPRRLALRRRLRRAAS